MDQRSGSALIVAVRGCLKRERSAVLRSYAVIGALLSLFILALLILALPTWVARTTGTSATLMLAQGLLFLIGLGGIAAIMAPILLAYRRLPTPGEKRGLEVLYGGIGYGLVLSIYVALIISAPADQLGEPPSALEPIVSGLNALDPLVALVPPLAGLIVLFYVDRHVVT